MRVMLLLDFQQAQAWRYVALDDYLPDIFGAADAATRGLAEITRNTGEFRNTGVQPLDPWTAGPQ